MSWKNHSTQLCIVSHYHYKQIMIFWVIHSKECLVMQSQSKFYCSDKNIAITG